MFDEEGRALLVRRARAPLLGEWTLPGGCVREGEAPTVAVEREILEETGLCVRAVLLVETVELETEGYAYSIEEHLCILAGDWRQPCAADDALDARWIAPSEWGVYSVPTLTQRVLLRASELAGRVAVDRRR